MTETTEQAGTPAVADVPATATEANTVETAVKADETKVETAVTADVTQARSVVANAVHGLEQHFDALEQDFVNFETHDRALVSAALLNLKTKVHAFLLRL